MPTIGSSSVPAISAHRAPGTAAMTASYRGAGRCAALGGGGEGPHDRDVNAAVRIDSLVTTSCRYIVVMETIGLRELNQNPSRAVARVRAGESLLVTDRGKPILRMVPEVEAPGTLGSLVAEGTANGAGRARSARPHPRPRPRTRQPVGHAPRGPAAGAGPLIYFDSSALLKFVKPEKASEALRTRRLALEPSDELVASRLTALEISRTLLRAGVDRGRVRRRRPGLTGALPAGPHEHRSWLAHSPTASAGWARSTPSTRDRGTVPSRADRPRHVRRRARRERPRQKSVSPSFRRAEVWARRLGRARQAGLPRQCHPGGQHPSRTARRRPTDWA